MNAEAPHNGGASETHTHATPSAASAYVLSDADRDTSRLAYEQATIDAVTDTEQAILDLLAEHGPLVDDDLYDLYREGDYAPFSPQRIRTVRAGLVKAGKLRQEGRGRSQYGNPAKSWEVNA